MGSKVHTHTHTHKKKKKKKKTWLRAEQFNGLVKIQDHSGIKTIMESFCHVDGTIFDVLRAKLIHSHY